MRGKSKDLLGKISFKLCVIQFLKKLNNFYRHGIGSIKDRVLTLTTYS